MPKRKIISMLICFILLGAGSAPTLNVEATTGTVTIATDILNIRKGPGLSYPIEAKAKRGEKYNLMKQDGDWLQISLPGGRKGWVVSWLVVQNQSGGSTPTTPAPVSNSYSNGVVTADSLRIRSGPGTGFQVVGGLQKGQAVNIIESNENWVKIKLPSGDGWVAKEFISVQGGQAPSGSNAGKLTKATVTENGLNVRKEPSLQGKILGKLQKGQTVEILSQSSNWAEVNFSGKKAWTSMKYLKIAGSDTNPGSSQTEGLIGTVTATSLNVRDEGSLNGKVIGSVSKGQAFKILEEINNWAKIEYKKGSYGWVAGWFLEKKSDANSKPVQTVKESTVTILHNGTNIRKGPSTNDQVVQRANQGDSFNIISLNNDWYEISLKDGTKGYVAGWIVQVNGSAPKVEKPGAEVYTKGKTIVIDAGHGGNDNGASGTRGTLEKELTLRTAKLLSDKLKASGSNVVMTRTNDSYISLRSRVSTAQYHNADAFISIHYDSFYDRSVRGSTSYYYYNYQKRLAETLQPSIINQTKLRDRGVVQGNYHVLRELQRNAVLLELGYLSNPAEEMLITSAHYQEAVSTGIFNGLALYFKES